MNTRDSGISLKQLRIDKGLTAKELATKIGISQPYLSQIEAGSRSASLELLGKIAEAVDVSYSELLKIACHNTPFETYLMKFLLDDRQSSPELVNMATDIKVLLEKATTSSNAQNIKPVFNGHELTADEAARALAMLYILFPHYKEPKN